VVPVRIAIQCGTTITYLHFQPLQCAAIPSGSGCGGGGGTSVAVVADASAVSALTAAMRLVIAVGLVP
jgi:hypothetical protein